MRNGLLLLAALCLTAAAANRIRQGSPAGLIAALAGAFVFLALTPIAARFVPGELPRRLRAAVVALPFAAVLAVAAASLLASKYNADNMLYELGEILQGRGLDYMGHGRIGIWHRALALAMERPLLGTGADTFATAFSQRFPTFVEETSGAALYDAAHNEYLQYLCLFGIPGCLAYLVWLGSLIARAFRPAASDGWTAMLLAGVVGYGIQAFFGISIVIAAPVFFVTAALLESRLNGKQRRRSTANTTPSPAGMVRI